jgi:hypothetical protein
LENIGEGGVAFRFVVGRYGSGKSFLFQLFRNQAMEQGFVISDSDLSPERHLTGSKNHVVATYRKLRENMLFSNLEHQRPVGCDCARTCNLELTVEYLNIAYLPVSSSVLLA